MVPLAFDAAEGRIGTGVDREPETVWARRSLELQARDAGLHRDRQVVGAKRDDRAHPRQVEADPALQRDDVALEARSGAESRHGHARAVGVFEDSRDLLCRLRVDDDVGPPWRVMAQICAVLLEHGLDVAHAALVRHEAEQLGAEIGRDGHGESLDGSGHGYAASSRVASTRSASP